MSVTIKIYCNSFSECIPLLHIFISNSNKPKMMMMSKHPNNIYYSPQLTHPQVSKWSVYSSYFCAPV